MSMDLRVLSITLCFYGAVAGLAAAAPGKSQEPVVCEDFHHDADGSWTASRKVTLNGVTYDAGTAFPAGVTFAGKDWGAILGEKCR